MALVSLIERFISFVILAKYIAEFFGNCQKDGSSFMIILTLDGYDGFSQHLYHPST